MPKPKTKTPRRLKCVDYAYELKTSGEFWNGCLIQDLALGNAAGFTRTFAGSIRQPRRYDVDEKKVRVWRCDVVADPAPEKARSKKATK